MIAKEYPTTTFNIYGFKVEMIDFGYAKFLYPSFNGNAEYPANCKGWKQLCSYLRTILWMDKIMEQSIIKNLGYK